MFVKGCFGGAGRPVIGHSCEGKLLSGHAVPKVFGSVGPAVRFEGQPAGVRQFVGQARHSRSWSVADEVGVELAGDVTLQAAHDLAGGASSSSDLPFRRRSWRFGRSTSITTTP